MSKQQFERVTTDKLTVRGGLAGTTGIVTTGTATLVAGTVVVNTTAVKTASVIQLTIQSLGTVTDPKPIGVTARVNGTSFTIRSADVTDTSVIGWVIF